MGLLSGWIQGAVFCVSTASDFQIALNIAATNGEDDIIQVVQGTYTGTFSFSSIEGRDIAVLGGYTANCSTREVDPTKTIFDGSGGFGKVISINNSNGGAIYFEGFTVKDMVNGWGVYASTYHYSGDAGDITINKNIIKDNSGINGGGLFLSSISIQATSGTGTLVLPTMRDSLSSSVPPLTRPLPERSLGIGKAT